MLGQQVEKRAGQSKLRHMPALIIVIKSMSYADFNLTNSECILQCFSANLLGFFCLFVLVSGFSFKIFFVYLLNISFLKILLWAFPT